MNGRESPLVVVLLLGFLALLIAVVTFGVLHSGATVTAQNWAAEGALAGFIVSYTSLFLSLRKLSRPVLGSEEVMALVHLYHEGLKSTIMRQTEGFLREMRQSEMDSPTVDQVTEVARTAFTKYRQYLVIFDTCLGNMGLFLTQVYPNESMVKDAKKAARHLSDKKLTEEKKLQLVEKLIDDAGETVRTQLCLGLKKEHQGISQMLVWPKTKPR